MSKTIIAFVGKIGSGKTTAAKLLKEKGFVEETFAYPLKTFLESLGFARHELYGTQEEKLFKDPNWNISGRRAMQKFGTDICRDKVSEIIPELNLNNRTIFCRAMEIRLAKSDCNVVVSDARFPDEISLLKEYGGIIIKILRTCKDDIKSSHISETAIDGIEVDYTIDNNHTLESLDTRLEYILHNIAERRVGSIKSSKE